MDAERDVDLDESCANCGHVRSQHGTPCRTCVLVDRIPGETIRICLKFKTANADRTLQFSPEEHAALARLLEDVFAEKRAARRPLDFDALRAVREKLRQAGKGEGR